MTKKLLAVALLTVVLAPGLALADGPINLSLFAPVQIVKETESVTAFRFSLIYGKNVDMTGLDLSLVGRNTGSVTGVSWTAVGLVDGDFTGWQSGWLASVTNGNMQGLQGALYTKSGMGSTGLQLGFLNMSDDFSGLQFGVVNITENMRSGLQIGLVNIIKSKEKLKFFPIVNWSF
jgi:hypothetical protein